ncbi:MAG: hypothetical protein LBU00_00490 [Treponema sp.]|jgi:hypothetical protein|nr:hypothetical protein [Treponema sp.]
MSEPAPDFIKSPYFDHEEFKMKDEAPEALKQAFNDWLEEGKKAEEEGTWV